MSTPDWLAKDVEANDRLRNLKAATTPSWTADVEEYCYGPDGIHRERGVVRASEGELIFLQDYPHWDEQQSARTWVASAHEDDAEGRYDRLLAEYRRITGLTSSLAQDARIAAIDLDSCLECSSTDGIGDVVVELNRLAEALKGLALAGRPT